MSFTSKYLFITITNIIQNFAPISIMKNIKHTFRSKQLTAIYLALEESTTSNKHIHILVSTKTSNTYRRSYFKELLERLGTKAINIQTPKKNKVYKVYNSNKTYKNKPYLWAFEKITYCWIDKPEHAIYYDPTKYEEKIKTVVKTTQEHNPNEYDILKKLYDEFLNSKDDLSIKPSIKIKYDIIDRKINLDVLDSICDQLREGYTKQDAIYCLENYDKFEKMIEKLEYLKEKRQNIVNYKLQVTKYKPIQKDFLKTLDNNEPRKIDIIVDPDGKNWKSAFTSNEFRRNDTYVFANSETKNIAQAWNPKKHTRLIFDLPRGAMENLNTKAIEKLKDGLIFSPKYKSFTKVSYKKIKILILGNEMPTNLNWTKDRLNLQVIKKNKLVTLNMVGVTNYEDYNLRTDLDQ